MSDFKNLVLIVLFVVVGTACLIAVAFCGVKNVERLEEIRSEDCVILRGRDVYNNKPLHIAIKKESLKDVKKVFEETNE